MTPKKKLKVIVVEDDKFLLKAIVYKFNEAKFYTKTTTTAEEGLEVLKTWTPDVIVLDILLPGIGGYAFLRKVKNNPKLKNIPIIISSNLDKDPSLDFGYDDYIVKSDLDLDELVTRIRSHIK